jgi:aminoglycoside phosphotransferase (APT) family kinase protein
MDRAVEIAPAGMPTGLPPVLRAFVADHGEPIRWARTKEARPWVVITAEHVGYLAYDEPSRSRLKRELARMRWAEAAGVPIPEIVSASKHEIVMRRVPADPPAGTAYVKAAVAAADQIHEAPVPRLPAHSGVRHSPRRTLPRRLARLVAGRVDLREFVAVRRAASSLTKDELSHGDFHPNNVLFDREREQVHVIDWSYLGFQPRHTDLIEMWTQLRDDRSRRLVLDALLERDPDHTRLAVLLRWLAVRSMVEVLTDDPVRAWDRDKVRHARKVVSESRAFEKEVV